MIVGAVVPAAAFAALEMQGRLFFVALLVTGAHTLLLGVPVLLIFRRQGWSRPIATVVGGFMIGAMPIGSVLALTSEKSSSFRWLLANLEIIVTAGGAGALGAAAFWLTLKIFRVLP